MTNFETETKQQEMERDSLQGVISQMQGALMFATPESRPALATALRNATARLGVVEKKIEELQVARETEAKEQTNVIAIAQRESRLNQQERNTFAGFLKEDFFTKKDFGRLEQFYEKTWDRLSESGKNQMSHRIWEGIRHHEYTFDQLPPKVRERETERAYGALVKQPDLAADVSKIPEKDRSDFIRAYEAGKRDEAEKILERESFRSNMFRGAESKSVKHTGVEIGRDGDGKSVREKIAAGPVPGEPPRQPSMSAGKANLDVSNVNLDGLKLADASNPPSSAGIPRSATAAVKSGPSLGSG
jgi:hypothetical protein